MNFEETTVSIILSEMFIEGRKTLSQSEFDEMTEKYAKRLVKLFAKHDVRCSAFNEVYDKWVELPDDAEFTKWLNKVCR